MGPILSSIYDRFWIDFRSNFGSILDPILVAVKCKQESIWGAQMEQNHTQNETKFKMIFKSEQVPLSYSTVERVVASLQVMGVETIVAATATAAPYTVDSRGRITYLPKPKGRNFGVP